MYAETPFWSTYNFEAGTNLQHTQHRLFTTPQGCMGQGFPSHPMSITETNIREGGRTGAGYDYDVYAVCWEVLGGSESDRQNLVESGVLAWDWLQTRIEIAPLSLYHTGPFEPPKIGGNTLAEMLADIDEEEDAIARMGRVLRQMQDQKTMYRGMLTYKNPICIAAHTTFSVLVSFGSFASSCLQQRTQVRVILLGNYVDRTSKFESPLDPLRRGGT